MISTFIIVPYFGKGYEKIPKIKFRSGMDSGNFFSGFLIVCFGSILKTCLFQQTLHLFFLIDVQYRHENLDSQWFNPFEMLLQKKRICPIM